MGLFKSSKPVIAMIHLGALPGTAAARQNLREIERQALDEARIYRKAGVHGVMLENMHDTPYRKGAVGPEIVAAMAIMARAIKEASGLTTGIQILAGANLEAMAVAQAAGLDFVRVEGFAFAHVADEGLIESCAGELLRFRKMIGADRVQVWADVKKKHSAHAITADVSLAETAAAVEFMRGDALIVTGSSTGHAPLPEAVAEAKRGTRLPVLLGSGVTAENLTKFYEKADGFIVGSYFKAGGAWAKRVDPKRVQRFMAVHKKLSR